MPVIHVRSARARASSAKNLAWPDECECGAGDPCPVRNIADPPVMPEGFVRDEDVEIGEAVDAEAMSDALERFAKRVKSDKT